MSYYAYEYEVLMKLQNDYKIKSISIDSENYNAYSDNKDGGWNFTHTKIVNIILIDGLILILKITFTQE